jgi:hypothetical protein
MLPSGSSGSASLSPSFDGRSGMATICQRQSVGVACTLIQMGQRTLATASRGRMSSVGTPCKGHKALHFRHYNRLSAGSLPTAIVVKISPAKLFETFWGGAGILAKSSSLCRRSLSIDVSHRACGWFEKMMRRPYPFGLQNRNQTYKPWIRCWELLDDL